jgi:hypothetical protein
VVIKAPKNKKASGGNTGGFFYLANAKSLIFSYSCYNYFPVYGNWNCCVFPVDFYDIAEVFFAEAHYWSDDQ